MGTVKLAPCFLAMLTADEEEEYHRAFVTLSLCWEMDPKSTGSHLPVWVRDLAPPVSELWNCVKDEQEVTTFRGGAKAVVIQAEGPSSIESRGRGV